MADRYGLPLAASNLGVWKSGVRSSVRADLALAADLGFEYLVLDVSDPEIRPRSLDDSARRDLSRTIRRHGLSLVGLELRIPADDWQRSDRVARATDSIIAAVSLAADLVPAASGQEAPVPSSMWSALGSSLADEVRSEIEQAAAHAHVELVDFAGPAQASGYTAWRVRGFDSSVEPAEGSALKALTNGASPVGGAIWSPWAEHAPEAELFAAALDVMGCRRPPAIRLGAVDHASVTRAIQDWPGTR